jgi:hypothetical protein
MICLKDTSLNLKGSNDSALHLVLLFVWTSSIVRYIKKNHYVSWAGSGISPF